MSNPPEMSSVICGTQDSPRTEPTLPRRRKHGVFDAPRASRAVVPAWTGTPPGESVGRWVVTEMTASG